MKVKMKTKPFGIKKRTDLKYDLTIGMIVKNEEKYLERCLKAMLPLKEEIKCEIIITDTGSTDRTIEIAEKYADKVLHFEWCNDFSKARNTGVEVSEGAWFLFVDADEIFDESVMEIAKFIKSKDRDKYDNAAHYMVNYFSENRKDKHSRVAFRLFNFTLCRRMFNNEIHEYIPKFYNTFYTDALSHHYGYNDDIIDKKRERNSVLLEKNILSDPNNIGLYKYYLDVKDIDNRIEVARRGIDVYNADKVNNYKNLSDVLAVNSLYYEMIKIQLLHIKDYDVTIKTCEEYLESDIIKIQNVTDKLPVLNITMLSAIAFYRKHDYKKAIEKFKEYKRIYDVLEKRPDTIFDSVALYHHHNENDLYESLYTILNSYYKLEDEEGLFRALIDYPIYQYKGDNGNYPYFNRYLNFVIQIKQSILLNNMFEFFYGQGVDVCNEGIFNMLLSTCLNLNAGIDYYLNNCSTSSLINKLSSIFNIKNKSKMEELCRIINLKSEYVSLKEMLVYINLMRMYVMNMSFMITSESTSEDKTNLNEIFELYIKSLYRYVVTIYNPNILAGKQFELLSQAEIFAYLVYPALEQKNSNPVAYIKALKDSLAHCSSLKDAVNNTIDFIQLSLDGDSCGGVQLNTEFQLLSEKIKLSIIDAIKSQKMEEASLIIEEYKKINPTDPDIANLSNLLS